MIRAYPSTGTLRVLFTGLCLASCSKPVDPEKEEAEAVKRNRAESAARLAKKEGRDPESIAARKAEEAKAAAEANSFDSKVRAVQIDACKRLAQDTRDCKRGKPCKQAGADDVKNCTAYMRREGLDENPF